MIDQEQSQDPHQVQAVSTNRDRIRCYKCREYDCFARECPNAITDEDSNGLEQATLQMLTQDNQGDSDTLCFSRMFKHVKR